MSLTKPSGLIIDLDTATDEAMSHEHKIGTITYLAPEIISLKEAYKANKDRDLRELPPYTCKADLWSLGLNMFALQRGDPTIFGGRMWYWIRQLLQPEAKNRRNAKDIVSQMEALGPSLLVGKPKALLKLKELEARPLLASTQSAQKTELIE